MSEQSPDSENGAGKTVSTVCVILGAIVFVVLNQVTNGKVPGGAIGGAIGGVLGGIVGLVINSLRKK